MTGIINRKRRSRRNFEDMVTGYVLLLPFLLATCVFIVYPIVFSFLISFKEFSFLDQSHSSWVGLRNYSKLFHDNTFLTAMKNTFRLLVVVVPVQSAIALVLANILNAKLKAKGFFRTVYYLPYITSPVAVGAVMVFLFNRGGLVTKFMTLFGLDNVAWYADGRYAFYLVVLIMIWTQIGFYTVLYLSGLQNISNDIYEAARIDGANSIQTFIHLTVPLLRTTTFLVLVMGGLATLQVFDQPYIVSSTGGALPGSPGDTTLTMVMFLYTQAFKYYRMGYASAAAFVVFLMIFAITMIQYKFFEKPQS